MKLGLGEEEDKGRDNAEVISTMNALLDPTAMVLYTIRFHFTTLNRSRFVKALQKPTRYANRFQPKPAR
jgi:hypothetical protein